MNNKYYEALELHKILGMLSEHCSNEASKDKALNLEPSNDLEFVKSEISKTEEAFTLSVKYATPSFTNFKDITSALNRADSGSVLTLGELIEIKRVLNQTRVLYEWYTQFNEIIPETKLDYLFQSLFPNKFLENKLNIAIISDEELSDEASAELSSIRTKIAQAGLRIRDTLDRMIKSTSTQRYLQDAIVTVRDGRYVVPVKTEHKNNVSGLVHDTSASGATLFIEPVAVVEANNEIRILKGREQDEIQRILSEFSADCAAIKDTLLSSLKAAIELNLYFAKANLAAKMNATTPEITQDGVVILKKARHPLISKETVVPISFELGTNYDSLIITGPNTGGKTVILKTVGLLTAMTMCGMLIPVSDESQISIFKNILVDIGDNQSIEQSLSTFSSHMTRVIEILDVADSNCLVLLDELGSGTDPIEGAALAISIINKLREKGARVVTTTHYQELKMFALDTAGVENASCEFDVTTLKPTYKLIIGSPGKSNAFAISESLGIPQDIILYAQNLISEDNKSFESIIDNLEKARIELEDNNKTLAQTRKEIEILKSELEFEREKLFNDREVEIQKARDEATRIVNRVTRESENLLDELDKIKKKKNNEEFSKLANDAKRIQKSKLNQLYKDANPVSDVSESYQPPRPYEKGDNVLISDTQKKGILISTPDANNICFVQVGIMRTKINANKLRLVEKEKVTFNNSKIKKSNNVTKSIESKMTRRAGMELDIRGYASDEGVYEVDSFLDNAFLSGVSIVTIIHGKGTGVLKNAVRSHLKKHPQVKNSRRGVFGEGEDGVTVVELK
ncbi:MAG: endonuclease MutS2 [Clostridiales bacterium]|nr:endonuclease MutS2 [Clostridiales bacterium]